MTSYSPTAARRVFLALNATRWVSTGFVVPIFTLWMIERGLTVTQAMTTAAVTSVVVLVLELPTSGLADTIGRRPLYLTAALFDVAAIGVFITATSFWQFALAAALTGIFRALESGPLTSWFIDTVHASDPDAEVSRPLAHAGTVTGVAIGTASLASGALIWWHPLAQLSPLVLPLICWLCFSLVNAVAIAWFMKEPPRAAGSPSEVLRAGFARIPGVVGDSVRLVSRSRIIAALLLAEVLLAASIVARENLQPLRLAELAGGNQAAGALMGPVTAVAWGAFALGSALGACLSARTGTTWAAMIGCLLSAAGLTAMALATGPIALIVAFLWTYGVGGTGSPMHEGLIHREASAENRTTVTSLNSMVFFGAFGVIGIAMGAIATHWSVATAIAVSVPLTLAAVACYLPALRAHGRSEV